MAIGRDVDEEERKMMREELGKRRKKW